MCGVRRDRRRGESYEWILHRAETSSCAFRVLPSSMFVGCVVAVGCFLARSISQTLGVVDNSKEEKHFSAPSSETARPAIDAIWIQAM